MPGYWDCKFVQSALSAASSVNVVPVNISSSAFISFQVLWITELPEISNRSFVKSNVTEKGFVNQPISFGFGVRLNSSF